MKKIRIIALALAALMLAPTVTAGAYYMEQYEYRKIAAHTVADTARAVGYAESSAIIEAARADWWAAQSQIDADLDLLARVVYFEAGDNRLPDRQQQLVACVVLNRIADPRFPNTMKGVVYQTKPNVQYACKDNLYSVSKAAIPARCYENARLAAYGQVNCPASVVWQAGFFQGRGIYEKIGNTWFCWG